MCLVSDVNVNSTVIFAFDFKKFGVCVLTLTVFEHQAPRKLVHKCCDSAKFTSEIGTQKKKIYYFETIQSKSYSKQRTIYKSLFHKAMTKINGFFFHYKLTMRKSNHMRMKPEETKGTMKSV